MLLRNFVASICHTTQKDESGVGRLNDDFLQNFAPERTVVAKYGGNGPCMFVGTGNTPPTTEDLALDTDVSTSLQFITGSVNRSVGDMICIMNVTYKNTTENPITIKELGIGYSYSSYYGANVAILYTRSLLDSPVTMDAGESYTFSYEVDIE